MTKHAFISDLQVKPGHPIDHIRWMGQYVAKRRPDTIIQIGDWFDYPSLSSYDVGKKSYEGRNYRDDVDAGNASIDAFMEGIRDEIEKTRRSKRGIWKPRLIFTAGNHDWDRINRAIENDRKLEGTISTDDMKFAEHGWEVYPYLEVVEVDGIYYTHVFVNKLSGRPYGGTSIEARLKTVGASFSQGHQQVMLFGRRETASGAHYGLVSGNAYAHDEDYRGPQANDEWRGIVIKNEVDNGAYDPMFVSLNYICKKQGGISLADYRKETGLA